MKCLTISKGEQERKICAAQSFAFVVVLLVVGIDGVFGPINVAAKGNYTATGDYNGDHNNNDGGGGGGGLTVNRIGFGDSCSKDDILVFQGATSRLPNGIPTYTVEIMNVCVSGRCSISNIHLRCGWFSSARLINPRIFRRIGHDDCLVKNGEALNPGEALSFQYADTFKYPLSVASVAC